MTEIHDVLRAINLAGRTVREGAEEALAILERDHPEALRAYTRSLLVSDFGSSLRSILHGRRVRDRDVARAAALASGEVTSVLDLMSRLYTVEDGRKKALGELTADDRQFILQAMDQDIETRRRERQFLAELDARAGDQSIAEALDEDVVSDLYVKIVGEDSDAEAEQEQDSQDSEAPPDA